MGMQSLRQLYKIGRGPSSSHTIGPEKASLMFREIYPNADSFKAILYGSLALTGHGHGTDTVIKKTFRPVECEVVFNEIEEKPHPNTMELFAYKGDELLGHTEVCSIGGGDIAVRGMDMLPPAEVYPHSTFAEIAHYCRENGIRISDYVVRFEGEDIIEYLYEIWTQMKNTISKGLEREGVLPGGLGVERKAALLYNANHIDERAETRENRIVCAYAFATGEQNASGGRIVTAPTCGASGVLPAVLLYSRDKRSFTDREIISALATAGIIGLLIKTNASISGAECGCQAEVGSACSMAAAALAELYRMSISQIEYAAEIAIEHHLGLTCDPICGLVQIPCIERNAVAAMRAINAVNLANFLTDSRKISFDLIVKTMYETGRDLLSKYRETSTGGMAKLYTNQ